MGGNKNAREGKLCKVLHVLIQGYKGDSRSKSCGVL